MHVRTRKLALMEGLLAGVLFGTAAIFIKYLQAFDALSIALWRLIVACLALVAMSIVVKKPWVSTVLRKNRKELLALGVFLGLHFILFVSAVKDTTILNATVLVNTTPIFSLLVSRFLFKLRPSHNALLGLTISFLGLCVVVYAEAVASGGDLRQAFPFSGLRGDLEAILAALVESFYLGFGRKVRERSDVLSIMLPVYALAALSVGLAGLTVIRGFPMLPVSTEAMLALVCLGILPTAIAHTLYFSSLSNLESFETATMALLEPLGATILGIAAFHELPAPAFACGGVLILAGIFFIVRDKS